MAIPAIDSQFRDMMLVAERHRLNVGDALIGGIRRPSPKEVKSETSCGLSANATMKRPPKTDTLDSVLKLR